jgi:sulfite reductase beta subunit-like hemoprotein
MKKILVCLILVSVSTASASSYQGIIHEIRIATTSSGAARVSILTSGADWCRAANVRRRRPV